MFALHRSGGLALAIVGAFLLIVTLEALLLLAASGGIPKDPVGRVLTGLTVTVPTLMIIIGILAMP